MPTDPPAALRCCGLSVDYGNGAGTARPRPRRRAGRDRGAARAVRIGQVDTAAGGRGSRTTVERRDLAGRRRVASATTSDRPERRDVGTVFQNYALWPHLRVLDTVAYPMRRAGQRRRRPGRPRRAVATARPRRAGAPPSGRTVRRRAATGRPGPGARARCRASTCSTSPRRTLTPTCGRRSRARSAPGSEPAVPRSSTPPTTRPRPLPSPIGLPLFHKAIAADRRTVAGLRRAGGRTAARAHRALRGDRGDGLLGR